MATCQRPRASCAKGFHISAYHQPLLSPGVSGLTLEHSWSRIVTGGPAVPMMVAKGPPLASALPLPPGLVPAPLNDVADGAEDRVLHGRSCPWPGHSQSSRQTLLGATATPGSRRLPSIATTLPRPAPTGLSPAWVALGLGNKGVFLGSVTN